MPIVLVALNGYTEKTAQLQMMQAHVAIIGLGGVGSWAAEALARSGVGELTLLIGMTSVFKYEPSDSCPYRHTGKSQSRGIG